MSYKSYFDTHLIYEAVEDLSKLASDKPQAVENKDLKTIVLKLDQAMKQSFDKDLSPKINTAAEGVAKKLQAKYKSITDFPTLEKQAANIGADIAKDVQDTIRKLGDLAAQGNNKPLINFIQNNSKVFLQVFVTPLATNEIKAGDIMKTKQEFEKAFLNTITPLVPKNVAEVLNHG